jgi:hypothetical protein
VLGMVICAQGNGGCARKSDGDQGVGDMCSEW